MLLVYTHKITPRVTYIFKHIFVRILQIPIAFTSKVEDFVAHNGPKLSYTNIALGKEFFINSHGLLFEQGVNDIDITITSWQDTPSFFASNVASALPFDLFAASFYLLSRYEEYLPHVKDTFDRYSATESLAFKNNFLEIPLIDVWAFKFLEILKVRFPEYQFANRDYKYLATFDIDNAYMYKNKGIVRNVGGFVKDLFSLKFGELWNRILVVGGFKPDLFDTYKHIIGLAKKYQFKTIFFFLVADYSKYDKNIAVNNSHFQSLIKSVADYSKVGLHPSFYSKAQIEKLKKEKKRLEHIVNTPIVKSRQHYLRFDIPETYQHLLDVDITEEYSMGYASHPGFRASTCTPFYFYNIDFEIQTPLKVFPLAVMDGTLKDYLKLTVEESEQKILQLSFEVKKVGGTFITLFHNDTLSETERWLGWNTMFERLLPKITNK